MLQPQTQTPTTCWWTRLPDDSAVANRSAHTLDLSCLQLPHLLKGFDFDSIGFVACLEVGRSLLEVLKQASRDKRPSQR